MSNWSNISKTFKYLVSMCPEGHKCSDGAMKVEFGSASYYQFENKELISVEFWANCMPEMRRHHEIGPFTSEAEAIEASKTLLLGQIPFIQKEIEEARNETKRRGSIMRTYVDVDTEKVLKLLEG